MITHVGEAIVLRSWPFQESDLLVALFTRAQGKVKGVAKAAMKSRRRFGGALEPMTHVRAHYVEKPKQELVRMDSFEVLASPLASEVNYSRACGLAFLSEVLDSVLVEHDPHDAAFRLTLACLNAMPAGADVQLPVTYFSLWTTRLMGWLPELDRCVECGDALAGGAYAHATRDGLFCVLHRRPSARPLSSQALALAAEMSRVPLARVIASAEPAAIAVAIELRRYLVESLERHVERKLVTNAALRRLR